MTWALTALGGFCVVLAVIWTALGLWMAWAKADVWDAADTLRLAMAMYAIGYAILAVAVVYWATTGGANG